MKMIGRDKDTGKTWFALQDGDKIPDEIALIGISGIYVNYKKQPTENKK